MNDLRTAAQQALEALEYAQQDRECPSTTRQAITALRAALAERQEPVVFVNAAHLQGLMLGLYGYAEIYADDSVGRIPLYTSTPPKHMPLSEDEIDHVANNILTDDPVQWWRKLARAIERAHGIVGKA